MEILQNLLLFFGQTLIVILAIIAILAAVGILIAKAKDQKSFKIELLHETLNDHVEILSHVLKGKTELKAEKKKKKAEEKEKAKAIEEGTYYKSRIFVLDFLKGDIKASATEHLREEISTVLGVATPNDEVVVRIESPGGLVNSYGLAAAQLLRIRSAGIPLTICVDQVAASGGYLMACTANKIIAAPFALIGSIGVVAQVPNFNRLLKKHDVDYKEYTAGDYKRTVSLFGEITEKGEAKFKEQLELTHDMFKTFVGKYRTQLDLSKVATGEFWYGEKALSLGLVDEIRTSDDYIFSRPKDQQIIRISYENKPSFSDKLSDAFAKILSHALNKLLVRNNSIENV
ncbi:MAG: putative periplasmic protease [Pseudobdellovibrio sp.]|jgi:serine protease SohB|nr:putative periplasmic protease [Pseudobdellovibrio sp.]